MPPETTSRLVISSSKEQKTAAQVVAGRRGRGSPGKSWNDAIREDLQTCYLSIKGAEDGCSSGSRMKRESGPRKSWANAIREDLQTYHLSIKGAKDSSSSGRRKKREK